MIPPAISPCRWSTASFGNSADTSPTELRALGEHLNLCKSTRGHLFTLQCAVDSLACFMAARFFTTLVVASVLIGICALVT